MKCKIIPNGVEFTPENKFEEECLAKICNQSQLSANYEDKWNRTGPVTIYGQPHPWDESNGTSRT